MKQKGRWFRRLFLIILGIVILLYFAGVVVEGLFTFGVIQTDEAVIRTYTVPGVILSLAFLIASITLWIKYLKRKTKLIAWWHAIAAILTLSVLYKIIKPTMLVLLGGPSVYFPVTLALIAVIWYLIWKKLKKEYN